MIAIRILLALSSVAIVGVVAVFAFWAVVAMACALFAVGAGLSLLQVLGSHLPSVRASLVRGARPGRP